MYRGGESRPTRRAARLVVVAIAVVVPLLLISWGLERWFLSQQDPEASRSTGESTEVDLPDPRTLQQILEENDLPALRARLFAGEHVTGNDAKGVPLLFAARSPQALELLLRFGADPNRRNPWGETPLIVAARAGKLAEVRLLLAAGASVDASAPESSRDFSALFYARLNHRHAVVKLLTEVGARDLNVLPGKGLPLPSDGGPPFAVCREYLRALGTRDLETLRRVRGDAFDPSALWLSDREWENLRGFRPFDPRFVDGFYDHEKATLRLEGKTPEGPVLQWEFQLQRIAPEQAPTRPEQNLSNPTYLEGPWRILYEVPLGGRMPAR